MSPSSDHLRSPPAPVLDGSAAPRVGDTLGNYHLDALAGEGGMGLVFSATHVKLGKRVAVKVLRRRYAGNPKAIARFFREARAVNVIRHPNIIEVTDFVEGPDGGESYCILEWLDGMTLAARLERDRVLEWREVVSIGRQIASALGAVHRGGFIHRDLKPGNIFLVEGAGRRQVKLLDFGVAVLASEGSDGVVAGTPAYFSPEGAAGRPLDGRSDLYSLGVVLYEMLAGVRPFDGASLSEYVMKHMTARPRPLAEVAAQTVPSELVAVVERCLEKDPAARFQTMEELEAALATIGRESRTGAFTQLMVRRPSRLVLAGVSVLLVAIALVRLLVALRAPSPSEGGALVALAPPSTSDPAMPPQPERVVVHVESDPPGAEVYRDGVVLGTTPCDVRVPPGPQRIELARSGSHRSSLAIEAREGARYAVHLDPEPPTPSPAPPAATDSKPRPVRPSRPPQKRGKRSALAKTLNPFH